MIAAHRVYPSVLASLRSKSLICMCVGKRHFRVSKPMGMKHMIILGWPDTPSTAAVRNFRLAARAVLLTGCLLLPGELRVATAQSTTADITGTVTDVSGASLPHAKVTLTNLGTKEVRTAQTTDAGDYTFSQLGPGTYSIQVSQSGFKSFSYPLHRALPPPIARAKTRNSRSAPRPRPCRSPARRLPCRVTAPC